MARDLTYRGPLALLVPYCHEWFDKELIISEKLRKIEYLKQLPGAPLSNGLENSNQFEREMCQNGSAGS